MRKLVAFLLTGLALYGAYWFAANRLFDEGSYRKQVAFGSVFVPYGWAYALGFLGALVLLVLLYSLLYTALVNRLQGRRKSPWPLFLQGVTHLFLWVLILLVYYPVVQVVAASFDPTNNLFSFRRPDTGFLLVDAKVIPYLPNPSLENYAKLVEGVVLYPYQVALALLAGLALTEKDYRDAVAEREALRLELVKALRGVDALLLPVQPLPAPPLGTEEVELESGRKGHREAFITLTLPFSLLGVPTLALPFAKVEGMPVGLQVVGAYGEDGKVLALGGWLEARLG